MQPVVRSTSSANILTVSTLFYPPNADGVRWFLREVFPLVKTEAPAATLSVVGPRPPKDIAQFAVHDPQSITVTGYVPDLLPYLEQAAVMVVPVRAASGMRVRILEALARGIPVVTTTTGVEGIAAVSDEHLLVADEPAAFAHAVARLLREPELGERLAHNGRRLVQEKYDWQAALPKLEEVYASLTR
jgi:glycosyltransferase involved in cell wall biosynthesis